jgi:hypothetical protein
MSSEVEVAQQQIGYIFFETKMEVFINVLYNNMYDLIRKGKWIFVPKYSHITIWYIYWAPNAIFCFSDPCIDLVGNFLSDI